MKKNHRSHRRVCNSWYHQLWFRILLVLVGVDMIILGGVLAVNLDILEIVERIPLGVRMVFGVAYILVALFIIHYALSYGQMKRESHFVCQHCGKINS